MFSSKISKIGFCFKIQTSYFRYRSDFDRVVAMADIEFNNTVYNSSNSNSISDSLIGYRPPSENRINSEIAQDSNEIGSIADSSSANNNLSSDTSSNAECEIDNSKNSRENQAETEVVSESEVNNTRDPVCSDYVTFEFSKMENVLRDVMKLD